MTPHRIDPHPKKFALVDGKRMAYVELGGGETAFLFLHGNPTSSYLWRNVMPERARSLRGAGPDRHGRLRQDRTTRPRYLSVCDAPHATKIPKPKKKTTPRMSAS